MFVGGAVPFFTMSSTLPDHEAELVFISSSRRSTLTATISAFFLHLLWWTDPAHGIDGKAAMYRHHQFGIGGNTRPAARDLPFFRADVFQPHGAHLLQALLYGLARLRRAGHASANVVGEFLQIVIRFIAHHALPGDRRERRHGAVLSRRRRFSGIGRPVRAEKNRTAATRP